MKNALIFVSSLALSALLFGNTASKTEKIETIPDLADGCRCYANGTSYGPGGQVCLGGYRAVCVASSGVGEEARGCGWDYFRDRQGYLIPCSN